MREGLPQERIELVWVGFYGLVALLGVRLLQIQVVQNVYYARVAERNRTQIIYQTAPRGRIYDRNGEAVATNRPAFSLIYLPGKKEETGYLAGLAASLAEELPRQREDLLEDLKDAVREESAIHLAENLPLRTMFKLSEIKTIYPGVDLIVESRRYYPRGRFGGHLLGYMGKMDKAAWRRLKTTGYRVDSWVGRTGIEQIFERELKGTDGEIRMEVDAQGRLKRILDQVPWKAGGNVHLAIDARVQAAAEEALRKSPSGRGGAVVLDPRNGDILALASVPDYDPNLFLLPDWDEARRELKDFPEFNNAISGVYQPGSTFKIVVGAAMLNDGRVNPADRVFCPGSFTVGNRTFKCWEKKGHRYQDWLGGLTHSCDVYFYTMGLRAGGEAIERYTRLFHLGQKTRVALPGEKEGHPFGPLARRSRGKGWYDGDTVNLSIGQGELLVTPIQMAVAVSAVANRGTIWRPHFTRRIDYADGREPYQQKPEALGRVELKSSTWDLLRAAMKNVVVQGTGVGVRVPGLDIYGKTGTAQNPLGEDHAWFVAFAARPDSEPSVAVSVLVQHGGHGSSAAGPVAKRVLEAAFGIGVSTASANVPMPVEEPAVPVPAAVPEPALRSRPERQPLRPSPKPDQAPESPLAPPRPPEPSPRSPSPDEQAPSFPEVGEW